jgi:IS30 family transposase
MKIIKAKESELVKQAAIELLENWKPYLFTITSDNTMHQEIATVLEVDLFLQILTVRGNVGNENLNGLIRQYIPNRPFEEITIERIIVEIQKLNNRPKDLILSKLYV